MHNINQNILNALLIYNYLLFLLHIIYLLPSLSNSTLIYLFFTKEPVNVKRAFLGILPFLLPKLYVIDPTLHEDSYLYVSIGPNSLHKLYNSLLEYVSGKFLNNNVDIIFSSFILLYLKILYYINMLLFKYKYHQYLL